MSCDASRRIDSLLFVRVLSILRDQLQRGPAEFVIQANKPRQQLHKYLALFRAQRCEDALLYAINVFAGRLQQIVARPRDKDLLYAHILLGRDAHNEAALIEGPKYCADGRSIDGDLI